MDRLLAVSRCDEFLRALSASPPMPGSVVMPVAEVAAALSLLRDLVIRAVIIDLATVSAPEALTLAERSRVPVLMMPAAAQSRADVATDLLGRELSPVLPPADGQVRIGPLVVDTRQWRVELHHQEIALSSREFRLLDYFIRHANQVMSREAIINHVWSPTFEGTDRVVDVCLSRLRRAVFDRAECPVAVRAVPGVGYKLIAKGLPAGEGAASPETRSLVSKMSTPYARTS